MYIELLLFLYLQRNKVGRSKKFVQYFWCPFLVSAVRHSGDTYSRLGPFMISVSINCMITDAHVDMTRGEVKFILGPYLNLGGY